MAEPLRVEGLRKSIEDFVLEADFSVAPGERAVLVGKSGSGKTTLLRILAGLETRNPSAGDRWKISLGTEDISELSPQHRKVGLIFQDHALFPSLSVLQNAIFGLRMQGTARDEATAQGLLWLDKVGLKDRAESSIAHLSGGEAQRVAFVRALIWKPRLLLLDEPFTALDAELRDLLRSELIELHRLWPVPMLLVSHDIQDCEKVANAKLELRQSSDSRIRTVTRG